MKGDCDEFLSRDEKRKQKLQGTAKENSLLSEVAEQDEEKEVYKSRLKQLETAFYYNLELISERDLELTVLEKQLVTESEKLRGVIRERHELEDLVKVIDEESHRKIQQLESRLSFKEGEVKELQRENAANINTLKKLVDHVKQQQERKIYKLSTKFEREKNELIKRYQEETEEKEKYYLLEIDHLAGKLEQVCREKDELAAAEEENKSLKCQLQEAERHFLEKENHYLEKIRKLNNPRKGKLNREVQCNFKPEGTERVTQARPDVTSADSQTIHQFPVLEEQHLRKIKFLQEQNEVLKCVVKDLKRSRKADPRDPGQPPGCECSATRTEIEQVNEKFENEISNLKKILQEELEKRTEEDAVIESLEATVMCLKDKLLLRLQEEFEGPEENSEIEPSLPETEKKLLEKKVAEQIFQILEHYKQDDPVGLPNIPVPDPMSIPDMKHSFSVATMNFKNVSVHGLSNFRIQQIQSNIADMEVSIAMGIEQLLIEGQYTMSSWFSRSQGDFNVTLQGVTVKGLASLEVNHNGQLEAQNINMDITFHSISMNFQNLGFMGSLFQGIINSVGTFLFDSIKPFILSQVNTNVRGDVNKHIMEMPQRFPNSIPPLDMVISEMRKYARNKKYDPYRIDDYNNTAGIFTVELTHVWLMGLATFHRVGNVTVAMRNNVLHVGVHAGTKQLHGSCHWGVGIAGLLSRAGTLSFTAEYLQANFTVSQPLDVRKKPKLEDFNLKLGNIQMRVNGAGTVDYILEFLVNVAPNILRYQIVDAVEGPVKQNIQNYLDQMDVEQMIDENLPRMMELFSLDNSGDPETNGVDY